MASAATTPKTRHVLERARDEALEARARNVDAEHILLALAAFPQSSAGQLLTDTGLDHEGLLAALREEYRASLAHVGVEPLDESRPRATASARTPGWGASAKDAVVRGKVASQQRHRRMDDVDLLVGVLQAELGTVARALAIAGVDRAALLARAAEVN